VKMQEELYKLFRFDPGWLVDTREERMLELAGESMNNTKRAEY